MMPSKDPMAHERDLLQYCEAHTGPVAEVLQRLERETHLRTLAPQMLSGHLQGQFLRLVSTMIKPVRVLEIGTFTGYSAICLAGGLADGGTIHTIEANKELEYLIRKYITEAQLDSKIMLHIGDALEIMPTLPGPFDLVWIDAAKQDYAAYYDLVFEKVSPGGFILADNVLWSGKVIQDSRDGDAEALRNFNKKVQADLRVENVLLPIRDGILLVRKLPG
jgi:caffeoyl-CoA O-methyltransferase